ncbi:MAG: phosphodiester glycosidase family protein [Clostridium sp.]|uniref:phosphodiester glycosidase family protein n=1 Tax=Clostridium sp. TaxID=1506 RepID=UPI0029084BC4|nr:phosphodiester glycosidase family protein [Clostridium sp.]MDU7338257.1 phosphodiester glycosidase family protein [Clostridium sp.]
MKKKAVFLWPLCYGLCLTIFTAYVLLDAFVIPRSYAQTPGALQEMSTDSSVSSEQNNSEATTSAVVSDTSYKDSKTRIEIKQYRENDTTIYVADIVLTDSSALKTALANNTYGKNITQRTSAMAEQNNALLAINGDYYSARSGYVIRNGVLYRETSSDSSQEDLVIKKDGSFEIVTEGSVTAKQLLEDNVQQVLSFGPSLVKNGEVSITQNEEVGKAMASNPRTAIGQVDDLHYVMVVSDGRTEESAGLSLYQLADFMENLGVKTAYNLDGGGSSTMVFRGQIINQPTTGGNKISERKVSDIVYIG